MVKTSRRPMPLTTHDLYARAVLPLPGEKTLGKRAPWKRESNHTWEEKTLLDLALPLIGQI
jgi:hypothetical protein